MLDTAKHEPVTPVMLGEKIRGLQLAVCQSRFSFLSQGSKVESDRARYLMPSAGLCIYTQVYTLHIHLSHTERQRERENLRDLLNSTAQPLVQCSLFLFLFCLLSDKLSLQADLFLPVPGIKHEASHLVQSSFYVLFFVFV